jgi:hypothetical protein
VKPPANDKLPITLPGGVRAFAVRSTPACRRRISAVSKSAHSLRDIRRKHRATIFTVGDDLDTRSALRLQRSENRPILSMAQLLAVDTSFEKVHASL